MKKQARIMNNPALQLRSALFCLALPIQATIRYIKPTAAGTGDGSSWANASADLQATLAAAVAGDEIWVAAGTYLPSTGTDRSISFAMKNGVAIYGGFPNTGNPGFGN